MHRQIRLGIASALEESIKSCSTSPEKSVHKTLKIIVFHQTRNQVMFLDPEMIGNLTHNININVMRSHGVSLFYDTGMDNVPSLNVKTELVKNLALGNMKITQREIEALEVHCFYYLHPIKSSIDKLEQIVKSNLKLRHVVYFIPYYDKICQDLLTAKKLDQHAVFKSFNAFVFPLDKGISVTSRSLHNGALPQSYFNTGQNSLFDETVVQDHNMHFNPSCIYEAAESLFSLEPAFGAPLKTVTFGAHAHLIADKLNALRKAYSATKMSPSEEEICDGYDRVLPPSFCTFFQAPLISSKQQQQKTDKRIKELVIMDRNFDLVSALRVSQNYDGILDELFGIHNGTLKVESNLLSKDKNPSSSVPKPDLVSVELTAEKDQIYSKLRVLNFQQVPQQLSRIVSDTKQLYDKTKDTKDRSLGDLKKLVASLPKLHASSTQLNTHLLLTEYINNIFIMSDTHIPVHARLYEACKDQLQICTVLSTEQDILRSQHPDKIANSIHALIYAKTKIHIVLKLVCLHSQVSMGLKRPVAEKYVDLICKSYGYQTLPNIQRLIASGLLQIEESKATKRVLETMSKLRPLLSPFPEQQLTDPLIAGQQIPSMNHIFAGHVSISCAFIELYLTGKKSIREISMLAKHYNESVKEQYLHENQNELCAVSPILKHNQPETTNSKDTVVLFYFGGITRAELAALEILKESGNLDFDLEIITTQIFRPADSVM